ncbi:hypothetical protein [Nostoc sp.]|uniref:hypothetical protein n=1 Tax=Nostoc sp. TaxID=1180 RepID=UPI002FF4CD35
MDAAVPLSRTSAPPNLSSNHADVVPKLEQKVAGCLFGVCVDLPKIPIPGVSAPGGDILGTVKAAIAKQIGEAVGVGSPLLLDQKTAYPDVSDQVKDFHPQKLTITSAGDLQKPLPPGDYSLDVIAYCTQFSIHAPGRGLPYKLAPLMGKQAPAISALLSRGTLQGIAPSTLNANSWRIQAGLPLKQWSSQDQALIHKLIPEYEKGLEGDYLQQIENTYNQYRLVPGIPSFNDLLAQTGAPGQTVLQLRQARQVLSNQTISAERLPDMLYEPTGDGLPRVLPASKDSSPSHWAEIQPGVFARFTVIEGNLGKNLFEFRVTPKASAAINDNSNLVATKELDKKVLVSEQTGTSATPASVVCDSTHNTYSKDKPAQALIPACVSEAKADDKEPLPEPGDVVMYQTSSFQWSPGKCTDQGCIPPQIPPREKSYYPHVAVIIEGGVKQNTDGTVTITRVRSKWNGGAIYDHDPNGTPYGNIWTVWRRNKKSNNCDPEKCNWLDAGPCYGRSDGRPCFKTDKQNDIYIGGVVEAKYTTDHPFPGVDIVLPKEKEPLKYDCRGFVFGRRTNIISEYYLLDNQVQQILDDGYTQLHAKDNEENMH